MAKQKVKLTFHEQMSGFPWAQILVIICVRIAEPIAFTSLFPYVYFMVKDFGIAETEAEIAKYSGYLSSIFAFCQFLTAYNWGKFADKYGRKPTLMIGLTGSALSLLVLGFSKNYYWAFFARGLMGLLNGNVAVIRTVIGEIATERKHQALAFSTMPLIFQTGAVIGPMIGGYLSGTHTRFEFLKPLVKSYPYALPNLVIASLLILSNAICIFFLEETHYTLKYRRDYFVEVGDFIRKTVFGITPKERAWNSTSSEEQTTVNVPDEETLLIDEGASDHNTYTGEQTEDEAGDDASIQSVGRVLTRRESIALVRTFSLHEADDKPQDEGWRVLLTPHVFYAVVCNFIMSLHLVVHDEFLPVYLANDIARDKEGKLVSSFPFHLVGGLNFTSQDTGALLSSTGLFGIFVILVVFPYVDRNFDSLPIYRTLIKIFPITYSAIPYIILLGDHHTIAIFVAYLFTTFKTLATSISFPQILMIIHSSAPESHRAMINGATISISALARCAGPLVWGYIFSWAQAYEVAWVAWWSLSALALIAIYQSRFLRETPEEAKPVVVASSSESEEIQE
ncbi:hypothetical protein WICPIJ_008782 [Wickerhamomyces pijperi]|uniref:Major facilitator superfamily (MFS) profile domain-containing protein n=1 Tax=Wickerhamomyces pijperi TaxID=599730 RepID=A0A9P8TGP3_WICPI|nr:hypothetical protein WICPIJ_008782 [Wickerhamomyces pijperi]